MGQPIDFSGSNVIMRAPAGAENVQDMVVFRTRHSCVSCWELSAAELEEINRTGRVFLSVLAGGQQPPVYVGSESTCREVMIDFGPVWPIDRLANSSNAMLPETPPRISLLVLLLQSLRKIAALRDSESGEPFDEALNIADAAIAANAADFSAAVADAIRHSGK